MALVDGFYLAHQADLAAGHQFRETDHERFTRLRHEAVQRLLATVSPTTPGTLGHQRMALLQATLDLWWPDEPLARATWFRSPTLAELGKLAAAHLRAALRPQPEPEEAFDD